MTHFWTKLGRSLRNFRTARRGNVATTFALAALPVLATVGFSVDYSNANSVKAAMQSALDSTALMLSKDAATINNTQLQAKAKTYFEALFTRPDAKNITIAASYTAEGGSTVVVNGSADVPTNLLGIIGYNQITVKGSSTSKWGSTRLRVALVLDTTGSMSDDGKMPALKSATKGLLEQLQSAASTNGDVYVSIVPFSKNVNLGSGNFNASYIDWTDWEAEPATLSSKPSGWDQVGPGSPCPFTNNNHGFVCAPSPTSTSTTSSIPSSGTYSGYICPATDSGRKDSTKIGIRYNGCYTSVEKTRTISSGSSASCGSTVNCSCSGSGSKKVCTQTYFDHPWVVNAKSTWNGCVTDRGNASGPVSNYDRLVTAPSANIAASKYPAEQNAYCSPEVVGLNYNWAAMHTLVNNLYPLGATNQPIGLVWGWQTLVGGGPFTAPPKDSQYTYTDVIVLMSDGLNTLNRWSGNGSSTSTAVDARMVDSSGAGTCANIKAAGITIYAVHVNTDGDPMSTLLKNCASQDDKFWMVTSANGLGSVFSAIGSNLTKLRVAK
ncbi:MAG: pilus assembly protein [Pseudolabrys sp.]|nr:pilus assembly protein [Pseudolabrys sp.]